MPKNRPAPPPEVKEKPSAPVETAAKPAEVKPSAKKKPPEDGVRETIESIAMAVILALIFRAFVAEAFVIPTGSMAPTLQGRHKDVWCPECNLHYQTGASGECAPDGSLTGEVVVGTTCPNCRFTQLLDLQNIPNDVSFSGDRIIVSKFSYSFGNPERWDVIVFKFPGGARDNYIKRLVGLPKETVRIEGGNIYVKPEGDAEFQIARKPPDKLNALLQLVHDNDHLAPRLKKAGWKSFWYDPDAAGKWKETDEGRSWETTAGADWSRLRFRHVMPRGTDWDNLETSRPIEDLDRPARLVLDMYAYNAHKSTFANPTTGLPDPYDPSKPLRSAFPGDGLREHPDALGQHWVDDLALDCTAEVTSATGELALELLRAGSRYQAVVDVATGEAKLSITAPDGAAAEFAGEGKTAATPTAITAVKGPGTYRLRLSNVDHELLLWVNGAAVKFDGPTTYDSPALVTPVGSATDAGDAEPAYVSARNWSGKVSHLKILRDKYYIAAKNSERLNDDDGDINNDYRKRFPLREIGDIMADPEDWATTELFASRRRVEFEIPADAFMPMGDNSPYSKDARIWAQPGHQTFDPTLDVPAVPHFVKRDLMVGKALMIYWPHAWNSPYLFPNYQRMSLIR